jgi:hypothetical protein
VHTDIGDTCVGAKINGRIMPLVTRLANGDEVEILRSGVQVPPPAWEEIVVTGKARAAIRRATKAAVRKQYSGLGMRILERTFTARANRCRARASSRFCTGSGTRMSRTRWLPWGAVNLGPTMSFRRSTPITRRPGSRRASRR